MVVAGSAREALRKVKKNLINEILLMPKTWRKKKARAHLHMVFVGMNIDICIGDWLSAFSTTQRVSFWSNALYVQDMLTYAIDLCASTTYQNKPHLIMIKFFVR